MSAGQNERELAEIKLSKGYVAIIDREDLDLVSSTLWSAAIYKRSVYAQGRDLNKRTVMMHRMLLDAPSGIFVDHINGNGLDNRRANLRLCTQAQNNRNSAPMLFKSSAYKGVHNTGGKKPWVAAIKIDKKSIYIGAFANEIDAARAYERLAVKCFGDFARLSVSSADEFLDDQYKSIDSILLEYKKPNRRTTDTNDGSK